MAIKTGRFDKIKSHFDEEAKIFDEYFFKIAPHYREILEALVSALVARLPAHEAYFPKGQWTDKWERFFAEEHVREQIFLQYEQEIPYSCAVEIEVFREMPGEDDQILAAVHVARAGQKPIIIGKAGAGIKRLRETSQKAIEAFLRRRVELHLTVKITPNWQDNPVFLREIGFYDKK